MLEIVKKNDNIIIISTWNPVELHNKEESVYLYHKDDFYYFPLSTEEKTFERFLNNFIEETYEQNQECKICYKEDNIKIIEDIMCNNCSIRFCMDCYCNLQECPFCKNNNKGNFCKNAIELMEKFNIDTNNIKKLITEEEYLNLKNMNSNIFYQNILKPKILQ